MIALGIFAWIAAIVCAILGIKDARMDMCISRFGAFLDIGITFIGVVILMIVGVVAVTAGVEDKNFNKKTEVVSSYKAKSFQVDTLFISDTSGVVDTTYTITMTNPVEVPNKNKE